MQHVAHGVCLKAFDPNINRKLTSQAPPRPITLQTEEEVSHLFLLESNGKRTNRKSRHTNHIESLLNDFNLCAM